MSVRILEGDALTVLKTLPDQSVQCCVTSPPYFGLRDYGVSGQLGLEKTPQLYVDAMVRVFSEVKRVLRDDGTLWLNIGDSYAGSFGAQSRGNPGAAPLSAKQGSGRTPEVWGTGRPATAKVEGCKPKDLIGIPWLLAFALRADGWYLRSDIIWAKPNPMPESVTDRPTKSHEYLFLLSKSPTYYYDADAIAEGAATAGETRGGGHKYRPDGANDQHSRAGLVALGLRPASTTRNARTVWSIATQPYSEAHFATFPPKLIEPCILAGSAKQACEKCGAPWERETEQGPSDWTERKAGREPMRHGLNGAAAVGAGGFVLRPSTTLGFKPTCDCENSGTARSLVLDPFGGAGTTGLVADRLGRDALLIELNPAYAKMARDRISGDNPLFTDVA